MSSRHSKKKSRGYTAIEVLLSLTILAIGASGVISMQRGAIQGNVDARRLDMASAITRQWTERLRRDAMAWTLPNASNPLTNNIANAKLLQASHINDGKWHRPDQLLGSTGESPAFDLLGRDVPASQIAADGLFCTNVRLTWLVTNELLRAEVRVFWPRNLSAKADADYCADDPPITNDPPAAADIEKYHFVYTVTSIRRNPIP
jgi:prepilin-type N-terminal cleavage/methylation domain-containing protein